MPQMGAGLSGPPQIVNLGKAFIEGHEVDGMRYIIPPPGAPGLTPPPIPGMPAAPQIPTVAEIWTSSQTKLPVLTTITGPFGQQVTHCKPGPPIAPPPPTQFQVPPGYKLV